MNSEVNYLILFNKKNFQFSGSERFCSLIELVDDITFDKDKSIINYKNSSYHYSLVNEDQEFENQNMELFDLLIESKRNETDIENLSELLREIRVIVSNQKGTLTPVFDGVSAYYAEKAYPMIHFIENSMRKLYVKFTLIKLGPAWVDSIPENVGGKKLNNNNGNNPLYDLDFIKISELLFNEYATKEMSSEILKDIKDGTVNISEIEEYIAQSNWDRYFSSLVDCESNYLEIRWKKLYNLRNKIAHNKLFTKNDLNEVKKITDEVKEKLLPAFDKISSSDIKIPLAPTVLPQDSQVIEEDSLVVQKNNENVTLGTLAAGALVFTFLAALSK